MKILQLKAPGRSYGGLAHRLTRKGAISTALILLTGASFAAYVGKPWEARSEAGIFAHTPRVLSGVVPVSPGEGSASPMQLAMAGQSSDLSDSLEIVIRPAQFDDLTGLYRVPIDVTNVHPENLVVGEIDITVGKYSPFQSRFTGAHTIDSDGNPVLSFIPSRNFIAVGETETFFVEMQSLAAPDAKVAIYTEGLRVRGESVWRGTMRGITLVAKSPSQDGEEVPAANARVNIDGVPVGLTSSQGTLEFDYPIAGRTAELTVRGPNGLRGSSTVAGQAGDSNVGVSLSESDGGYVPMDLHLEGTPNGVFDLAQPTISIGMATSGEAVGVSAISKVVYRSSSKGAAEGDLTALFSVVKPGVIEASTSQVVEALRARAVPLDGGEVEVIVESGDGASHTGTFRFETNAPGRSGQFEVALAQAPFETYVQVIKADNHQVLWQHIVEPNGQFTIRNAPYGPYIIRARTPDGIAVGEGDIYFDRDASTYTYTVLTVQQIANGRPYVTPGSSSVDEQPDSQAGTGVSREWIAGLGTRALSLSRPCEFGCVPKGPSTHHVTNMRLPAWAGEGIFKFKVRTGELVRQWNDSLKIEVYLVKREPDGSYNVPQARRMAIESYQIQTHLSHFAQSPSENFNWGTTALHIKTLPYRITDGDYRDYFFHFRISGVNASDTTLPTWTEATLDFGMDQESRFEVVDMMLKRIDTRNTQDYFSLPPPTDEYSWYYGDGGTRWNLVSNWLERFGQITVLRGDRHTFGNLTVRYSGPFNAWRFHYLYLNVDLETVPECEVFETPDPVCVLPGSNEYRRTYLISFAYRAPGDSTGGHVPLLNAGYNRMWWNVSVIGREKDTGRVLTRSVEFAGRPLFQMPAGMARYPVRTLGGDEWVSRGTYQFLSEKKHLLVEVGDLTLEHGRRTAHNAHDTGRDIDMNHFYRFPGVDPSTGGAGTAGYMYLRKSAMLVAQYYFSHYEDDPGFRLAPPEVVTALQEIRNWIGVSRAGLTSLARETRVRSLLYGLGKLEAQNLGNGDTVQLEIGWMKRLLATGQLGFDYYQGHERYEDMQVQLDTDWNDLPTSDTMRKMYFDNVHYHHVHITLDQLVMGDEARNGLGHDPKSPKTY